MRFQTQKSSILLVLLCVSVYIYKPSKAFWSLPSPLSLTPCFFVQRELLDLRWLMMTFTGSLPSVWNSLPFGDNKPHKWNVPQVVQGESHSSCFTVIQAKVTTSPIHMVVFCRESFELPLDTCLVIGIVTQVTSMKTFLSVVLRVPLD